jgi:hypothetical protein
MKMSRLSEEQIVGILKESEAGVGTSELARKRGSAVRRSIGGRRGTTVWKREKRSGCSNWEKRTGS